MAALVKDIVRTVVSPAQPAQPPVPAISFHMYATPPPIGYTYRQLPGGLPNSLATFSGWSQLVQAPLEYSTGTGGYVFMSLEELANQPIPANSSPVYGGDPVELTGYLVPVFTSGPLPPRYYGPLYNMTFVVFPGVPVAPNGYPLTSGLITGYMDIPTTTGVRRVNGTYFKNTAGVWLRVSGDPLPDYCVIGGSCRVVALADFPGVAGIPATAAVVTTDYNTGWNAGADSIDSLDGDVRTVFTMDIRSAGAVGFCAAGTYVAGNFRLLSHCFMVYRNETENLLVAPMERGRFVGASVPYSAEIELKIEREDGVVSYFIDGDLVHISSQPSGGPLEVCSALHRGGDTVL